jgi:hypothetical protein
MITKAKVRLVCSCAIIGTKFECLLILTELVQFYFALQTTLGIHNIVYVIMLGPLTVYFKHILQKETHPLENRQTNV